MNLCSAFGLDLIRSGCSTDTGLAFTPTRSLRGSRWNGPARTAAAASTPTRWRFAAGG